MREWLREIRGKRSQLEIANQCGVSHQMYNFIENGKRRPSVAVAKRIGAALGFDWTRLFNDGGGGREVGDGGVSPSGGQTPRAGGHTGRHCG